MLSTQLSDSGGVGRESLLDLLAIAIERASPHVLRELAKASSVEGIARRHPVGRTGNERKHGPARDLGL